MLTEYTLWKVGGILATILVGYITYNEREKSTMKRELNKTLCKKEVEHLIDLKAAPEKVMLAEISKDIKSLQLKLDELSKQLNK